MALVYQGNDYVYINRLNIYNAEHMKNYVHTRDVYYNDSRIVYRGVGMSVGQCLIVDFVPLSMIWTSEGLLCLCKDIFTIVNLRFTAWDTYNIKPENNFSILECGKRLVIRNGDKFHYITDDDRLKDIGNMQFAYKFSHLGNTGYIHDIDNKVTFSLAGNRLEKKQFGDIHIVGIDTFSIAYSNGMTIFMCLAYSKIVDAAIRGDTLMIVDEDDKRYFTTANYGVYMSPIEFEGSLYPQVQVKSARKK
jgi:hypothetical protein